MVEVAMTTAGPSLPLRARLSSDNGRLVHDDVMHSVTVRRAPMTGRWRGPREPSPLHHPSTGGASETAKSGHDLARNHARRRSPWQRAGRRKGAGEVRKVRVGVALPRARHGNRPGTQ